HSFCLGREILEFIFYFHSSVNDRDPRGFCFGILQLEPVGDFLAELGCLILRLGCRILHLLGGILRVGRGDRILVELGRVRRQGGSLILCLVAGILGGVLGGIGLGVYGAHEPEQ
uniref:Uncharacterized protein n=1 Tax=Anopheles atroparvus TaxID=41427 RepID=A0AAG5DAG6_ANOAO